MKKLLKALKGFLLRFRLDETLVKDFTITTPEEAGMLRKRVEYEDSLFNTRAGIILSINALAGAAIGTDLIPAYARLTIACICIAINFGWFICAREAAFFIRALTSKLAAFQSKIAIPRDEAFRLQLLPKERRLIRPTTYFAYLLPWLLIAGWIFACLSAGEGKKAAAHQTSNSISPLSLSAPLTGMTILTQKWQALHFTSPSTSSPAPPTASLPFNSELDDTQTVPSGRNEH